MKSQVHRHFDAKPDRDWVQACWKATVIAGDVPEYYRIRETGERVPDGHYILKEQTGNCYVVAPRDLHSLYSPARDETDLELCFRFLERHHYVYESGQDRQPTTFGYQVIHADNGWTSVYAGNGWGDEGLALAGDYDETGTLYAFGPGTDHNDEPV